MYAHEVLEQIGWVFIYVFVFGVSDFFAEKYLKHKLFYFIIYYLFIALIGTFLILKYYTKKY
jgi:hypothetical protein